MAELVPRDEFDDRVQEDAEGVLEDEETVYAYMLFTKPQLDALVRILRKAEQRAQAGGFPSVVAHASDLLDQAQSVQANYERNIQPDYKEES